MHFSQDDVETKQDEPQTPRPAWIITFADLMAILMCFFVLQLSFSKIERDKFNNAVGSIRQTFGAQNNVPAFSNLVNYSSVNVEINSAKLDPNLMIQRTPAGTDAAAQQLLAQKIKLHAEALETVRNFKGALSQEIETGQLEVEAIDNKVIIRIPEAGSFASGTDELSDKIKPVIEKLALQLKGAQGDIQVMGYTDDVPIDNNRFRSNWDLSAMRAASVVEELARRGIDPNKLIVMGFGSTHPLASNDSAISRAKNRRVEIVITHQ